MEKGHTIQVLDHGYVKYIDSMGNDETVIEAARMSTGRGFEGWEKDGALLDFLWRKKHATPFEMVELSLEVQAPLFVFREWHRHRTQSYNEFSARYSKMPDIHYVPDPSRIRKQSASNKQGTGEEEFPQEYIQMTLEELEYEQKQSYSFYEQMIEGGIAKEVARINTPVSRYSKMRAKTNLRNWLGFLNLRLRPNAQFEIRVFADAVETIIKNLFPRTHKLFEEYDLFSVSFSRKEMEILRQIIYTIQDNSSSPLPIEAVAKSKGIEGRKLDEFIEKVKKGGLEILS